MRSMLGLVAVAAMILGPLLAWLRLVPAMGGFVPFALGGVVALVVAVASVVQGLRGRGLTAGGALGLVASVVFVGAAVHGGGGPLINDYTTDLRDPPAFRHAGTLPANAGRDLAYPPAFAPIQQACCADLQPIRLAVPPAEAYARAERVARSQPDWAITATDPQGSTFEAVATSRLFGFHDDIVVRIRPDGDAASIVDMRSKSRNGKGDRGVNADRIRAFVVALRRG